MNPPTVAKSMQSGVTSLWFWTNRTGEDSPRLALPCTDKCIHMSQADADRHYYDYSLGMVVHDLRPSYQPCRVCGKPSDTVLYTRYHDLYPFDAYLCDEHRNREHLAHLFPFRTPLEMEIC